ncbi:MAG: hypothetical protein A2Y14_05065 [Verrucomicrobia bacterium GWF2_51_19]|nr:MAG: hypothetical protein A2Y14_05065 [Verrucomicrobia bacterium GWF2_51_19]HCJ11739.1 NUDIX hydrolase [Opitutae bacterium]
MDSKTRPAHWELREDELFSSCSIYSVHKQRFRHPVRQQEGQFYVIKTNNWVQAIALTPEKNIILVQQYRFGIQALSWETPGGALDGRELPIAGAARELQEETGYVGKNAHLIGQCYPNPAIQDNTVFFVLIEDCVPSGATQWDTHEELATKVVTIAEAFDMVQTGEICHGIPVAALFYLQSYLTAHASPVKHSV